MMRKLVVAGIAWLMVVLITVWLTASAKATAVKKPDTTSVMAYVTYVVSGFSQTVDTATTNPATATEKSFRIILRPAP